MGRIFRAGVGISELNQTETLTSSACSSMILHGIFDSPLLESGNPLVSGVLKGLPILVLLLVLLRIARIQERELFKHVTELEVPSGMVTADELQTLVSIRERRKARKTVRKGHGLAASHAMRRLQRAQIVLIAATQDTGRDSDESKAWAAEIEEDRRVLAEVTA